MPTMSRKFQKTATGRNAALCQKDFEVRAESHDGILPSNVMLQDRSAHARFRELKKLSCTYKALTCKYKVDYFSSRKFGHHSKPKTCFAGLLGRYFVFINQHLLRYECSCSSTITSVSPAQAIFGRTIKQASQCCKVVIS